MWYCFVCVSVIAFISVWRISAESPLAVSNSPPSISILWPKTRAFVWPPDGGFPLGPTTRVKLKAEVSDADGNIREVRFYASTNLVGTVTNPPYNVIWTVIFGQWPIRAVAVDNKGAETVARAGRFVGLIGRPAETYIEINRPANGAMFAAPASFEFSAEVVAGTGGSGPIEFLLDGSPVGLGSNTGLMTATTPPSVIVVSNLLEGNHALGVRYAPCQICCDRCYRVTNTVRVVKLGVHTPRVRPDGVRQFEVATSYGGKLHVIEGSPDLQDWCAIAITNAPATNSFTFVVPHCDRPEDRYYRVLVPQLQ